MSSKRHLQIIIRMQKIKQMLHVDDKDQVKTKQTNQMNKNIIGYLMKNAYLQNKMEFYVNLDVKAMESLITTTFKQNSLDHESKIFVISLLKKQTFILNIAFTNQKFDYTDLFSFLHRERTDADLLNALEDILIPFCKKFPQKFLNLMTKNIKIKQTFLSNIYTKQIFKILYTAVFCCEQNYFKETQEISLQIMQNLINSIFYFSPTHKAQHQPTKAIQYGQVSWNLKDFIADLTINLVSVELILVERFIALINSEYIQKILAYFDKFRTLFEFQDYCEGIIFIFINLLKLLETFKLSVNSKTQQKDKLIKSRIQSMLCADAIGISSNLPTFIQFLLQKNQKTLHFSSGETIQRVGLLKYRILELIQKILSINQIENLNIPFEKFDFFPVIITFLDRYKWNSIAHNLIVKITKHIISQDYKHFKIRHLQTITINKGLFGQFIIHFRNRKFMFLHSMRMINQGHRSLIFRVSQIIIQQMQERNDLNLLVDMFKIWKQYMQTDLAEYQEKNYQTSLVFNGNRQDNSKRQTLKFRDTSMIEMEGRSSKPLEKFEQILISFKQEQKWSPKQTGIRIKKQNLMDHEQLKKIDSLAHYLPPNS